MKAFPKEDLAADLKDVDIGSEHLPPQRSLGLMWNLNTDRFTFNVSDDDKPFTRRGMLSVINSLYDPLGFISPIIVQGRILMRDLIAETVDWDLPLSEESLQVWMEWRESLKHLVPRSVPRTYFPSPFDDAGTKEIHIFGDASEKVISAVAYLKRTNADSSVDVGFVLGKSKVAPKSGHTIPRLELCAAVLAVEIGEIVSRHLDFPLSKMKFYSDSRVVLGYLNNKVRRFFVYVENRVSRILKSTERHQWHYVASENNPADQGTRPISSTRLDESTWLKGPEFLRSENPPGGEEQVFVRQIDSAQCMKTHISSPNELGTKRFEKFSSWSRLIGAINRLRCRIATESTYKKSENFIIQCVQNEVYKTEILCLKRRGHVPVSSAISSLDPYLDDKGMLRLGGRIKQMNADLKEKNPLILPGNHHISTLLVRHYHEKVKHMGRHFTDGAVRSAGIWITGVKRLISSLIYRCVICRKLRARTQFQKMSDLPLERLTPTPPFKNVGLDVFGPWQVVTRRTRGGIANNKRWAVLYTCLTTRAVHVEVIEQLSTSAFINATRRFIAIRGKVSEFRSDRGTNFVGATDLMKIDAINVEDNGLKQFLFNNGVIWRFNSPHSSHMGGVWERMIGVVRRVLDSMMLEHSGKDLTHDVLVTFMAEVTAIINSRPLVPVSTDPENPAVLSPSMLLTQKSVHDTEFVSDVDVSKMYKADWRHVQALSNIFWKRWRSEYLQTLQSRRKWQYPQKDLGVDDIVLVKDDECPRNNWPMGRVVNTFPSKDGHVRNVAVKLFVKGQKESKVYTRPVTELVLLM